MQEFLTLSTESPPSAGIVGKVYRKEWPSDASKITPEFVAEWVEGFYDTYDFEDWDKVCQTNVSAVFFMTLGFLPLLVKGVSDEGKATSSVINISSIWGHSRLNYGVVSINYCFASFPIHY